MNESNNTPWASVKEQKLLDNLPPTTQDWVTSSLNNHKRTSGGRLEIQRQITKALEEEYNEVSSTFIELFVETYQEAKQSVLHCASCSTVCVITVHGKEYSARYDPALHRNASCVGEWAGYNYAKYQALLCLETELENEGWKPTLLGPVHKNPRPCIELRCDFSALVV